MSLYFWSEYCPESKKVFPDWCQCICVDNPLVRSQILGSKKVKITKVPCILIIDQSQILQFEGEKALEYIQRVQNAVGTGGTGSPYGGVPAHGVPYSGVSGGPPRGVSFEMSQQHPQVVIPSQIIDERNEPPPPPLEFKMAKMEVSGSDEGPRDPGQIPIKGSQHGGPQGQGYGGPQGQGYGGPQGQGYGGPQGGQGPVNGGPHEGFPEDITPISQIRPDPPKV